MTTHCVHSSEAESKGKLFTDEFDGKQSVHKLVSLFLFCLLEQLGNAK